MGLKPGQVCLKDIWPHTLVCIEKKQYDRYNSFFTISIDLGVRYKREIHMKIDAPWSFL